MRPALTQWIQRLEEHRELALAIGVAAIIAMLILPVPGWLLDFGLALSITLSILILMASLFIERPLELSAFPTILLIATMLRLGLNMASTRLILSHGHEGPDAAGEVIAAFGQFLMGGEPAIGVTIFLILILINFVVITKGAGRIAEVAARFSLDAMPGKQMAIDADLNAGMIDETTARTRRSELEAESGFYGAMDGASKFVKGDAIAGLIITAVNIFVGLGIGTISHGVDLGTAFHTYTILTVGDGLVSQIPALLVSTAAGLLVTKGGEKGKTGAALGAQLGRHPQSFGMASALLIGLALMPGLPFIPFAALGGACGLAAWRGIKADERQKIASTMAQANELQAAHEADRQEPPASMLAIDPVRIEIGYALLPLVKQGQEGTRLDDQVKALRRQMATDYGFLLPPVRILDNLALPSDAYVIHIRETEIARANAHPDRLLVIDPADEATGLAGQRTREPVFGLPAVWITRDLRAEAEARGLTAVDSGTMITTHLGELVRDNIADLLSYAEVQKLLDDVHKDAAKLIGDVIPARLSISGLQRILQNLLAEGVSIRDLPTILEGVAEATQQTHNLVQITEHVRARLARQISAQHLIDGMLPVLLLSPAWDDNFMSSIVGEGDTRHLAMAPSMVQQFIGDVRAALDRVAGEGQAPAILVSPAIRPFVRAIIERVRPATVILSQNEVHVRARLKNLGVIGRASDLPVLADAA